MKSNSLLLDEAIKRLELQRENDRIAVKMQWETVTTKLKPGNIVKDIFSSVKKEPEVKSNILQTAISIGGGFLSKKLLFGKSKSIWGKLLGYGIQFATTKFLAKHVDIELPEKETEEESKQLKEKQQQTIKTIL